MPVETETITSVGAAPCGIVQEDPEPPVLTFGRRVPGGVQQPEVREAPGLAQQSRGTQDARTAVISAPVARLWGAVRGTRCQFVRSS